MNLETMQVPLIAYLATIFVMGLVQWYLIYARDRTQIPPVPVGPVGPWPPVPQPGPAPAPIPSPPEPIPAPAPQPAPAPGPAPGPGPAPIPQPAPVPVGSDFDNCVAVTLREEGGNDVARGKVDRTSRGIEQKGDWDVWRQTHPGLPADVFDAPNSEIKAIYKQNYWNPLFCDSLPNGVDLVVFDHGVLAGIGTSARLLQTIVGTDVDGEIGPLTIAAAATFDPVSLVGRFCDGRQAYYDSLNNSTYIKGWTNRVVAVRKDALALAAEAPRPKSSTLPPAANIPAPGTPPWLTLARSLVGTHAQNDNKIIMAWPRAIAAKYPDMAEYCGRYVHDSIAWCGLFAAYVLAMNGIEPVYEDTDTGKFLWADAWRNFGTAVTGDPQPGDVLVFKWAGGGEHVTFYDHEEDDNYYHCTGGNQGSGHVVSTEAMPMANCIAIRRPQS
jgi:lysozyme family protein